MKDFKIGEQPCQNFKPEIMANERGQWENVHECPKCGGNVSFCDNCARDHHDGGWNACKGLRGEELAKIKKDLRNLELRVNLHSAILARLKKEKGRAAYQKGLETKRRKAGVQ